MANTTKNHNKSAMHDETSKAQGHKANANAAHSASHTEAHDKKAAHDSSTHEGRDTKSTK